MLRTLKLLKCFHPLYNARWLIAAMGLYLCLPVLHGLLDQSSDYNFTVKYIPRGGHKQLLAWMSAKSISGRIMYIHRKRVITAQYPSQVDDHYTPWLYLPIYRVGASQPTIRLRHLTDARSSAAYLLIYAPQQCIDFTEEQKAKQNDDELGDLAVLECNNPPEGPGGVAIYYEVKMTGLPPQVPLVYLPLFRVEQKGRNINEMSRYFRAFPLASHTLIHTNSFNFYAGAEVIEPTATTPGTVDFGRVVNVAFNGMVGTTSRTEVLMETQIELLNPYLVWKYLRMVGAGYIHDFWCIVDYRDWLEVKGSTLDCLLSSIYLRLSGGGSENGYITGLPSPPGLEQPYPVLPQRSKSLRSRVDPVMAYQIVDRKIRAPKSQSLPRSVSLTAMDIRKRRSKKVYRVNSRLPPPKPKTNMVDLLSYHDNAEGKVVDVGLDFVDSKQSSAAGQKKYLIRNSTQEDDRSQPLIEEEPADLSTQRAAHAQTSLPPARRHDLLVKDHVIDYFTNDKGHTKASSNTAENCRAGGDKSAENCRASGDKSEKEHALSRRADRLSIDQHARQDGSSEGCARCRHIPPDPQEDPHLSDSMLRAIAERLLADRIKTLSPMLATSVLSSLLANDEELRAIVTNLNTAVASDDANPPECTAEELQYQHNHMSSRPKRSFRTHHREGGSRPGRPAKKMTSVHRRQPSKGTSADSGRDNSRDSSTGKSTWVEVHEVSHL